MPVAVSRLVIAASGQAASPLPRGVQRLQMLPVSVPEDFDEGQLQEQSSSDADVSVAESTASMSHPAEVLASESGEHRLLQGLHLRCLSCHLPCQLLQSSPRASVLGKASGCSPACSGQFPQVQWHL